MPQPDLNLLDPPEPGILPSEFKVVDYPELKWVALWRLPNIINKLPAPVVWAGYEYWDTDSSENAFIRLRFIAGVLNGARDRGDLLLGELP